MSYETPRNLPVPGCVRDADGRYDFGSPVAPDIILRLASEIVAERFAPGALINKPRKAREYFQALLNHYEREVFACLWLNTQLHVLKYEELFFGTIDATSVYPREVVKSGLRRNAAKVIFSHNHPSGRPEPSAADRAITNRLKEALALVDIQVLDHIVVGGAETVSMSELGMI